jgi:ATP-dependent helicase/nuclease subunit A
LTVIEEPVKPADHESRERILEELDRTFLVEAAAGTGKTTSMVGRMTALIRQGRCPVGSMAAVTFTRKAAAELRSRFQADLEKAAAGEGEAGARAAEALHQLGHCFIGTIHSFCGRLLRERPVEAGVDISFREADEREDALLREEAWFRHVDSLFTGAGDAPAALAVLGLEIGRLRASFLDMADYGDVEEWPAPPVVLEGLAEAREELSRYVSHIDGLAAAFPEDRRTDELMNRYEWIARMVRVVDLDFTPDLMEVFGLFNPRVPAVQKWWPGGAAQGKEEKARWQEFCDRVAAPLLTRWREARYAGVMPVLQSAQVEYDRLRRERGVLSYQDLLLAAARLLRNRPAVRRYFRKRFTHLLVDEFQDTDPVQAEVMMLLTATDPKERDWRKCLPRPGSLFVVGDPRQSIYRFRRADILTYTAVREIIEESGGETIGLNTNFRSGEDILQWGNGIFSVEFPVTPDTWSPAARPMEGGREEGTPGDLRGVRILDIPEEMTLAESAVDYEADFIARYIRRALDGGFTIPRSPREIENGAVPAANPGDFMIVCWRRRNLSRYAAKLQGLGIPHRVSGGSVLSQVAELRILSDCLLVLTDPENPVALLALLRGDLFGFSDETLYEFRKAGGRFFLHDDVPEGMPAGAAALFRDAWKKIRLCELWLRRLPPVPAMEKIASYLGLTLRSLLAPGADERAGTIAKAFETLRKASREDLPSAAELNDLLRRLIEREEEFDGIPACMPADSAVRIMNLHKVKGLEAPVVFLADPTGNLKRAPTIHVDRGGEGTAGYLTVSEEVGEYGRRILAQPPGWEELSAEEGRFAAAEYTRLQYVAATRARSMLVITRKTKRRNTNPWDFFSPYLDGFPPLDDPGAQRAPTVGECEITAAELSRAEGDIAERHGRIRRPSYALAPSGNESAPSVTDRRRPVRDGEHSRSRGTAVHLLLELAIRERATDIKDQAGHRLMEKGLDSSLAAPALEVVASVASSDLWRRALASDHVMAEVPVEAWLAIGEDGGGEPTPARCVIDLLFREEKGWVIVDYKTEAVPAAVAEERARAYRNQLDGYTRVWEGVTGEKVVERGVLFTEPGVYVTL